MSPAGMLKRTKYSRLRNDSLTSLEDWPLCLDSDFAQLDPGTPAHHVPSTLRDFIPRLANIPLQSPSSLHGLREQTHTPRNRTADGRTGSSALHSQHKGAVCCSVVGMASRAVHHHIKYMGSVEVTQSMRALDFETRMQVTREAISRLCKRTSAKMAPKTKGPAPKGLSSVLGGINLQFSGSRIILTVSTDSVTLIAASSLQKIAHHAIQAISFASGGEPDMADYIAYVAKDLVNQRACHILECPQGRAADVINSIGQAFETRFRQLLRQTPPLLAINPRSAGRVCRSWSPQEITPVREEGEVREKSQYYNVIPGKTPPPGGIEDFRVTRGENEQDAGSRQVFSALPSSLYENCSITEEAAASPTDSLEPPEQCFTLPETQIQDLIQKEGWFHGRIGREQAESLLMSSGDFLVRESSSACGQYVLSGMEGATVRHLLLVDPRGQVRTRDQVFLSVGHLVRFHMESQMPIVSGSSELCLKQPILQRP
ncbi:SHC-transforming protein 1-like [Aulostomus maculatus]